MGGILSYFAGEGQEEGEEASLLDLVDPGHFEQDTDAQVIWTAIRERLRSHPEEAAAYARSIDSSPFQRAFLLAQKRNIGMPLDIARLFLEAYEEVAFDATTSGETALFAAVHASSVLLEGDRLKNDACEIVKLLIQCNPKAASRSNSGGQLPIHHVRSDAELARVLIITHPEGAIAKDADDRLPLHHCCAGNHVRRRALQGGNANEVPPQQEDQALVLPSTHPEVVTALVEASNQQGLVQGGVVVKGHGDTTPLDLLCTEIEGELDPQAVIGEHRYPTILSQLWKCLLVMVQQVSPSEPFLNTITELNLPPAIMAYALSLYPQQASERDSKGRTPLMTAALSRDSIHPSVICTLLQFYPEAACMTDEEGRLPIDIIAETSQYDEELFEALVKAEPRAIDTRDLRDKMFPFMTAAVGKDSNVNTVYRLLRAKPHVMSYFNLE